MNQTLYTFLVERAQTGGTTIGIESAASMVGLELKNPFTNKEMTRARETIDGLLLEIDRHEHAAGRPLLSAMVVDNMPIPMSKASDELPSDSFFQFAGELGHYNGSADKAEKRLFHIEELARVYGYWIGPKK